MPHSRDYQEHQDRTSGPKERYRERRKTVKDSFQTIIQSIDTEDLDLYDWEDHEMFETFEPIRQRRKR